jgi:mannose-6-phosphate isomerase-like protein (cupin superfamily)
MHGSERYVKLPEKPSDPPVEVVGMPIVPPLLGSSIEGADFTIAEWVDDGESSAERPVAPPHVHDRDDEAWYVLEGTLGFRRGDEVLEASAGAAVLVPAGVPHTYWNAGSGRARYLLVLTPRIAALIAALHDEGALDDVPGLFRRFDSRLAE